MEPESQRWNEPVSEYSPVGRSVRNVIDNIFKRTSAPSDTAKETRERDDVLRNCFTGILSLGNLMTENDRRKRKLESLASNTMEDDNETLKSRCISLEAELEKTTLELRVKQTSCEFLRKQYDDISRLYVSQEEAIATLKKKEEENTELKTKLAEMEKQNRELQRANNERDQVKRRRTRVTRPRPTWMNAFKKNRLGSQMTFTKLGVAKKKPKISELMKAVRLAQQREAVQAPPGNEVQVLDLTLEKANLINQSETTKSISNEPVQNGIHEETNNDLTLERKSQGNSGATRNSVIVSPLCTKSVAPPRFLFVRGEQVKPPVIYTSPFRSNSSILSQKEVESFVAKSKSAMIENIVKPRPSITSGGVMWRVSDLKI